jgi:hypothetical protein
LTVAPLDPLALSPEWNDRPLPAGEKTPQAEAETYMLSVGLLRALRAPRDVFESEARSNVTIDELLKQPARSRGQLLRVYARPQKVREVEAPEALREYGAPRLFEVWGLVRADGLSRQVCLLSPMPPPGLRPGEKPPEGLEVALTGFFFKNYRPPAGKGGVEGHPDASAPLLLGYATPSPSEEVMRLAAAASVVTSGFDPAGAVSPVVRLRLGERANYWVIEDPSRPPPLDRRYLDGVVDGQPLPRSYDDDLDAQEEVFAYFDAILKASRTPRKVFLDAVRKEITYLNVHNEPKRYRGEIIRIDGDLARVIRHEPTLPEQQAGIKNVYEMWLLTDRFGKGNTACLITTELPPGITVAEEVKGTKLVSFVGYFFKKYRFKPADAKKDTEYRVAPMIVGYVVPSQPKAQDDGSNWSRNVILIFLAVLAGTIAILFVMTWASRRTDRRILSQVQGTAFPYGDEPPDAGQQGAQESSEGPGKDDNIT